MEETAVRTERPLPPPPGVFRLWQLTGWLLITTVLGGLSAWAALATERFFAQFLLFPLIVGVVLGGLLVAVMRLSRVGHRPTLLLGAALAVGLNVAGQHYLAYRQAIGQPDDNPAARALFPERAPPATFWEFMIEEAGQGRIVGEHRIRGAGAWCTWALDALLIAAPALILVALSARLPYCNRCRSWYHLVRGRRTDAATATALAERLGLKTGEIHQAKYRIIGCDGGCGPTGVALFWEDREGVFSSGTVWLDAEQHAAVLAILDRPAGRR